MSHPRPRRSGCAAWWREGPASRAARAAAGRQGGEWPAGRRRRPLRPDADRRRALRRGRADPAPAAPGRAGTSHVPPIADSARADLEGADRRGVAVGPRGPAAVRPVRPARPVRGGRHGRRTAVGTDQRRAEDHRGAEHGSAARVARTVARLDRTGDRAPGGTNHARGPCGRSSIHHQGRPACRDPRDLSGREHRAADDRAAVTQAGTAGSRIRPVEGRTVAVVGRKAAGRAGRKAFDRGAGNLVRPTLAPSDGPGDRRRAGVDQPRVASLIRCQR